MVACGRMLCFTDCLLFIYTCVMFAPVCWCVCMCPSPLCQYLIRDYEMQQRRAMGAEAVSRMLSTHLYYRRSFPFYTFNVVGGLDREGVCEDTCYCCGVAAYRWELSWGYFKHCFALHVEETLEVGWWQAPVCFAYSACGGESFQYVSRLFSVLFQDSSGYASFFCLSVDRRHRTAPVP